MWVYGMHKLMIFIVIYLVLFLVMLELNNGGVLWLLHVHFLLCSLVKEQYGIV